MFKIIEEEGVDLEAVAVEEGTTTTTTCTSLDISEVEFDDE